MDGMSLRGAFSPGIWERHLASTLTTISPSPGANVTTAVAATRLTRPTLFEGFELEGTRVAAGGQSSYALRIVNSGCSLQVLANTYRGGVGAQGRDGGDGHDPNATAAGLRGTTSLRRPERLAAFHVVWVALAGSARAEPAAAEQEEARSALYLAVRRRAVPGAHPPVAAAEDVLAASTGGGLTVAPGY